jgi:seryl-tRNA synthetase
MKKTRNALSKQIGAKIKRVEILRNEIRDLKIEHVQVSDKNYQYKVAVEEIIVSRRPKVVKKVITGRVHWVQDFIDEDTGRVVPVPRSYIVMQDNVFIPDL